MHYSFYPAMVLNSPKTPLRETELPTPQPGAGQVLVRVAACAVCRTDLHVVDGELPTAKLPLVPRHEIAGRIAEVGGGVPSGEGIGSVEPFSERRVKSLPGL